MSRIFKIDRLIFIVVVFAFFTTSCIDNKVADRQEELQQQLQDFLTANNYTQDQQIGYGIYVKKITEGSSTQMPVVGNTVLMNYTGMYTNYAIFESTDIANSGLINDGDYYIYGPRRHKVGTLMFGFDTAVRTITEGTIAQFAIPYNMAFGTVPVVYDVELLKIIEDDSTYEADLFTEFMEVNNFDSTNSIANGLFYKLQNDDTLRETPILSFNDTLIITIEARYAENYDINPLGRIFYPRYFESDTIKDYYWGTTTDYPIISAIDSAVKYMSVGQVLEIAFKSGAEAEDGYIWGYGDAGLQDSKGIYLVSPYTPLHYTIKLLYSTAED
jgi:hypothetical protein